MSSNFPRFDGIILTSNAWIENLYVERMAVDPEVIDKPGRLWFNTTDNRMSWAAVAPEGNMVVYDFITPGDLTNVLEESKTYAGEQITAALSNIDTNSAALLTVSASLINTQALLVRMLSI